MVGCIQIHQGNVAVAAKRGQLIKQLVAEAYQACNLDLHIG